MYKAKGEATMKYSFLIATLAAIIAVLTIAVFCKLRLTNEQYDRLKSVVLKWQYLVVFVALIVKTLDVPMGVETVTIVSGLGAMLAGILGVSNTNYQDEKVTQALGEDLLKDILNFDGDLYEEYPESEETEEESEG